MAVSGSWKAKAVQAEGYTGALRWGTGNNPVHSVRSGPEGEQGKIISSGTTGQNPPPDAMLGTFDWGYTVDDSASCFVGEDYRYLVEDHANWGEDSAGRPDRDGQIMEEGAYPQPEGWPSWGPRPDENPWDGFNLGGPPMGTDLRSYSDGMNIEVDRAIAVPTPGVSGGWLNKVRSAQNESVTSDPSQYEVTTSMRQIHQRSDNTGAVIRQTDALRSGIASRIAGMKVKTYGKSLQTGGGPGSPDMYPMSQDLMYRPFYFRSAGLPPAEQHTWNEITYFDPVQRTVPEDPYAGQQSGFTQAADPSYGYSSEDVTYGY